MQRLMRIALIIMLIPLLTSCAPKELKPGDKIGNMEIVNYCEGNNIVDICTFLELQAGTCVVPASWTKFWVSYGWAEPTVEELETRWTGSTWTLSFDDHPVDLEAFGTYDLEIQDPISGLWKARVWSICIINPSPGEHTARYDYTFVNGQMPDNFTEIWKFTIK